MSTNGFALHRERQAYIHERLISRALTPFLSSPADPSPASTLTDVCGQQVWARAFLDHLTAGSLSLVTKYSFSWEEKQNSTVTAPRPARQQDCQSDTREVAFH